LGFKVFHGELHEAKLPDQYFDVITAGELLEHVFDPAAVLKEMARLLRPGGLLWTTTPHCRGLSGRLLGLNWSTVSPPEHLQLFSVSGLRTLLDQAGFREVTVKTEGANPYEILKTRRSTNGVSEHTSQGNEKADINNRLNTTFADTAMRRAVKSAVNQILRLSRLGDSLKVFAVK
jgi:ubiquinone/menaquinone biosynthesis C-methylase UbiE